MSESSVDMDEAGYADDGSILLQLIYFQHNLQPLQASIQIGAEQELLPEIKVAILWA